MKDIVKLAGDLSYDVLFVVDQETVLHVFFDEELLKFVILPVLQYLH